MEQTLTRINRRAGWSDYENRLLWETAEEAQQQGLPLKTVFERISEKTGRRPNSIRNYYYAQVRVKEGDGIHSARFTPFTQDEVDELMEKVLRARSAGQSVRSCLQDISGGDHSLMLRYQNKYRSVIKNRPEYVQKLVDKLNDEGIECVAPQVNHRVRPDVYSSLSALTDEAQLHGDPELARAIDVLTKQLTSQREAYSPDGLHACAERIMEHVRQFVVLPAQDRINGMDEFCAVLSARIDEMNALIHPIE
ncbi:MAG: hypothetical protein IJC56_05625 [Clostridia bacterium]|nr:hypothetical protein [Clostridia bacterium]